MDDIENDAILLLSLLDENIFPHFLEWNKDQKDLSKWILFLLQTDFLQFKGLMGGKEEQSRMAQFAYHIKHANQRYPLLTDREIVSLDRLCHSNIPFKVALAPICQHIWRTVMIRTRQLASSKYWTVMHNKIVTDADTVNLDFVLSNETYRRYLDRFLQNVPAELGALQCLLNARRLLLRTERFISHQPIIDPNLKKLEESKTHTPSIFTWRTSMKAMSGAYPYFASSSTTTNGGGTTNNLANASSTTSTSSTIPSVTTSTTHGKDGAGHLSVPHMIVFTDAIEALKILLFGMRSLQREFFPTVSTSFPSNNTATLGHRQSSSSNAVSRPTSNAAANHSSGHHPHPQSHNNPTKSHNAISSGHNNSSNILDGPNICAGLSDTSRVEIMAVLAQHTAVKVMSEVDSLDIRFASSAAKTIYDLLLKLERECYQFLQQKFTLFVQSQEYMKLTALLHCEKNPQVWKYLDRTSFLEGRVHREQLLHWASSEAAGVLYLPLHANEDNDEDEDGDKERVVGKEAYFVDMVTIDEKEQLSNANKSHKKKARVKVNFFEDRESSKNKTDTTSKNEADSKSNKKNDQDMGSDFAIDVPPVFALYFSACLPEFTALNQESLTIVPHRMRLWATDKAVLPSMKKFRVTKSSASTSPNMRQSSDKKPPQQQFHNNNEKDKRGNSSKARHFFSDNGYDISSPTSKDSGSFISSNSNPSKFSKSTIIRELSVGNHASTDDIEDDAEKTGGGGSSTKPGVKFAGIPSPKGRHMIQLDNEFRFSTASIGSDPDNTINNGDKDKISEENVRIPSISLLKKSLSVDSNTSSVYSAEELVTGYEGDDLVLSVSKDIGNKGHSQLPSVGVRQPSYGDKTTAAASAIQSQLVDNNYNPNSMDEDDDNDHEEDECESSSDDDSDSDDEESSNKKKVKNEEEEEEDDLGELLGAGEVDENGLPLDLDQAFIVKDSKDNSTSLPAMPKVQSKGMALLELHSEKIDRSVRRKMQVAQYYASQGYHPHHDHSQCHYSGMTPLHSELGSPASVCSATNQQGSLFHNHSSQYLDNTQMGALTKILLNQLWRCNLQQDVDLEIEQDNHHFVLLKSMELQVLYQHIFGTTLSTRHSLGQLFLSVHTRLVHSNPELRQTLATIQPHCLVEGNFPHLSRGKYRKIVHVSLVYAPVAAFSNLTITTPIPYRSCYQFMQHVVLGMQSSSYLPQRRMDEVTGVLAPTFEVKQFQSSSNNNNNNNSDRIMPFSPAAESKTKESPLPVPAVQLPSAMKHTPTALNTNNNNPKKKSPATFLLSGLIVVKPYKMLVYDDQCSYYHQAIKNFTAKLPPAFVARNDPIATIPTGQNTDTANNVDTSDKFNTPEVKQKPYDWTEETLYDLYLRYPVDDNTPNNTPNKGNDSDTSKKEYWTTEERMLSITRHCGICDFSMAGVLTTISTRLWLQIMMLVLTDRKVMLVSSSPTLLSKVYFMLHRLIWPFKVTQTSTEPFGECDHVSNGNDHNDTKSPHNATTFPSEYPRSSPQHHNHFQANADPALQAYYAYMLDYRSHDPFFSYLHTAEELFDYFGILPHESFYASHPSLFYLQKLRTVSSSVPVTPMNLSIDPQQQQQQSQGQTQTQTHALNHVQSLRPFQQITRAFSGQFTPVAGNNNSFTLNNNHNPTSATGMSNKTQSLLQGIANTNPGSNVVTPDGTPSAALLSPATSPVPMLKQAHTNSHSNTNFIIDTNGQSPNVSRTFSNNFNTANNSNAGTNNVPNSTVTAISPSVFSRIVCVDVRAYRQAQRMLMSAQSIQMPFIFPVDYDDQMYTVIDLDTSQQIAQGGLLKRELNGANFSCRSPRNNNNEENNNMNNSCSEYSLLDLRNDLLFRTANFPAFRELYNQIQTSTMDLFHTVIAAQLLTKPPPNSNNNNNRPCSSSSSAAETASTYSSESSVGSPSAISSLTNKGYSSAESVSSAVSSNNPTVHSHLMKSSSSVKRRQAKNISSSNYFFAPSLFGRVGFKAEEYHHSPIISLRSSQRLLQQQQSQKASEETILCRQQGRKLGLRQIEDDDEEDDEDYEEENVHQIVNADDIRLFKHTDSIASIASVLTGAHLSRTHSALFRPGSRVGNTSFHKMKATTNIHSNDSNPNTSSSVGDITNDKNQANKQNQKDIGKEGLTGRFGRRDSSRLSLLSPQDSGLWSSFNQSQRILLHLSQRPFHQMSSNMKDEATNHSTSDYQHPALSPSENHMPESTILIERFHEQITLEIAAIRASNIAIESAFHQFWMMLLLQAIPETLHYDPHAAVLGCDMQTLLALLLTRNHGELRLTHSPGHHKHHHQHRHHNAQNQSHHVHSAHLSSESLSTILTAAGSPHPPQHNTSHHTNNHSHNDSSTFSGSHDSIPRLPHHHGHHHHGRHHAHQTLAFMINGYTAQDIQHLSFEDFLTLYNDHTATAGASLAHAWYAECLAGLSTSFVDLIQRHGAVLVRHAY